MLKHEVVLAMSTSPTNGEMLDMLAENSDIRRSIKYTSQMRDVMGGGMAAALHHTFSKIDETCSDEFFSRLMDGLDLSADNPIYHLRERLLKNRNSFRLRMAEAERMALTIKSWNAFKDRRPLQLLTWRSRGATREALPAIN